MEIFKTIEDNQDYEISNFGRVRTKSRKVRYVHSKTGIEHFRLTEEKFLKVYTNNRTGYNFVQLYSNKKSKNKTIHRLVALAFCENPEGLPVVNHKDGNKLNNHYENLEFCTDQHNHYHAAAFGLTAKGKDVASAKLDEKSVHAIKWFLNNGVSKSDLSKAFLVSKATIIMISQNKTWKHIKLTGQELTLAN